MVAADAMSSRPSIYSDSDDDEDVDSEAGITARELSTFLRGLGSDPLGLLVAASEEVGAHHVVELMITVNLD